MKVARKRNGFFGSYVTRVGHQNPKGQDKTSHQNSYKQGKRSRNKTRQDKQDEPPKLVNKKSQWTISSKNKREPPKLSTRSRARDVKTSRTVSQLNVLKSQSQVDLDEGPRAQVKLLRT